MVKISEILEFFYIKDQLQSLAEIASPNLSKER